MNTPMAITQFRARSQKWEPTAFISGDGPTAIVLPAQLLGRHEHETRRAVRLAQVLISRAMMRG